MQCAAGRIRKVALGDEAQGKSRIITRASSPLVTLYLKTIRGSPTIIFLSNLVALKRHYCPTTSKVFKSDPHLFGLGREISSRSGLQNPVFQNDVDWRSSFARRRSIGYLP